MLASMTRNVGLVLLIPLIYSILEENYSIKTKILNFASPYLILLGGFIFPFYISTLTGDIKSVFQIQTAWGRELRNPFYYIKHGLESNMLQHNFTAIFVIATLFLLLLIYRHIDTKYIFYSLALLFIPLSTSLTSMPRYILVIFPLFLGLGLLHEKQPVFTSILLVTFSIVQGFMLVFWTSGFDLLM
jgi:hypothetical protein